MELINPWMSYCIFKVTNLLTPLILAASSILKLIIVLLYIMTEWFDWMKPIPPISAARLNTWSTPDVTFKQLSITLRSTRWNSWQNMSSVILLILLPVRSNYIMPFTLKSPDNVRGYEPTSTSNWNAELFWRPIGLPLKVLIGVLTISGCTRTPHSAAYDQEYISSGIKLLRTLSWKLQRSRQSEAIK